MKLLLLPIQVVGLVISIVFVGGARVGQYFIACVVGAVVFALLVLGGNSDMPREPILPWR